MHQQPKQFGNRPKPKQMPPGFHQHQAIDRIAKANNAMKRVLKNYHHLEFQPLGHSGKPIRISVITPKRQERAERGGTPRIKFMVRDGKWVHAGNTDYLVLVEGNKIYLGKAIVIANHIERKLPELKGPGFVGESYKQKMLLRITLRELLRNRLLMTIPLGQALRLERNILRVEQDGWKA